MREARLLKSGEVFICEITQGARLRGVSDAGVIALMSSIKELRRMKDEIHIRRVRHQGNALKLIAGAHRLEAAKRLGWEKIPAKIWDCGDDWAHLLEIDDNLSNPALAPLDLCLLLVARKRAYEKLHPETRQHHAGGFARQGLATDIMSFAENTAEKYNLTMRHIRRFIQAGAVLV